MVGCWDQGADEKTSVWRTGFLFLTAAFPGGVRVAWCVSIRGMIRGMSVVPHRLHEEGGRKKEGIHWADEVNIDAKRVWDSARVEIKIQKTERKISLRQPRHYFEQLRHIRRAQARRCADRVARSDRGYQVKHHA